MGVYLSILLIPLNSMQAGIECAGDYLVFWILRGWGFFSPFFFSFVKVGQLSWLGVSSSSVAVGGVDATDFKPVKGDGMRACAWTNLLGGTCT